MNWVGYDSAIPTGTTQTFTVGDEIENSSISVVGSGGYATANQKYTLTGWRRITTGTAHTLDTDWVEMRTLTGQ